MLLRFLCLLTALLTFVLVPGLARAGGDDLAVVQIVDGYAVTFSANHVETGPNSVSIRIHAPDGSAETDAFVSAAVIAYGADGHGDSHDEAGTTGEVAAHSDNHGSASAGNHGDDHADGHVHEAIPTMFEHTADPGVYRGILHFDQAGNATVTVAFRIAGAERATLFTVPVVQARPRALVLGGFAFVNGLAIVTAAVLKRRMPQKTRNKPTVPRPPVIPLATASAATEEERSV